MTTAAQLRDIADRAFRSLMIVYGLRYASGRNGRYGQEVTYMNGTTAVRVELDRRENRIFVSLFRVYNGDVPPFRDISERERDPLNGYDLEDLISLRSPGDRVAQATPGRLKTADDLRHILDQYAAVLPRVADDVLRGNFSVFHELATIRVRRIEDALAAGYPPGPEYESFLRAYNNMIDVK